MRKTQNKKKKLKWLKKKIGLMIKEEETGKLNNVNKASNNHQLTSNKSKDTATTQYNSNSL